MAGPIVDYESFDTTANLSNGWWHLTTGDSIIVVSGGSIVELGVNSPAVYVQPGAIGVSITCQTLIYGETYAIKSDGSTTRIQITGNVIGNEHAIGMNGSGFIDIGATGSVMSNNFTIGLGDAWLTNNGLISSSQSHCVDLDGGRIVNNGTITSGARSAVFYEGGKSALIANHGDIIGDIAGPAEITDSSIGLNFDNSGFFDGRIQLNGGANDIDNTGRITGDIFLGDGGDIVTSKYGFIGGVISTGGGSDIVQAGDEDNQIDGGAGSDNLDGGGGFNTLSYTGSTRGVRVNLATDVASHGDAGGDVIKNFSAVLGSLEHDVIVGDAGDNQLVGYLGRDKVFGGAGNDTIVHLGTGTEILNGGDGDDLIGLQSLSAASYGEAFTAKTTVNGGDGFDTLELANIGAPVTFTATTVTNVERFLLLDFSSYSFTTNNATVANAATLDIDASSLTVGHTMIFNGAAETTGKFTFEGGADADTFTGGGGGDVIEGGASADTLRGNGAADIFAYDDAINSFGLQYNSIKDFLAGTDKFQFDIDVAKVETATIANAGPANLLTRVHDAVQPVLDANEAVVVTITGGPSAGTFLVVDDNGQAGYQSGVDYLINITGLSGVLTTADFLPS